MFKSRHGVILIMKKIFVNGAFDVVHSGHLDLLDFARGLGTHLLVAIDTDRRIEYNKGKGRPFNNLKNRKELLSMLKPVTSVVTFDTDNDLLAILDRYRPDVMVKGSDWRGTPKGYSYMFYSFRSFQILAFSKEKSWLAGTHGSFHSPRQRSTLKCVDVSL